MSAEPFSPQSAFAYPRDFLENRFVYLTISPRAKGLSIGINLNPDKNCNFDCIYCEVDRAAPAQDQAVDLEIMREELDQILRLVASDQLKRLSQYSNLAPELLRLRHVALSGDGEPTLCPEFLDVVQEVLHLRALARYPFFKIVLITNASGLDLPPVQEGLKLFTKQDEVWAKLDVGNQAYMSKINRTDVPLEKILGNILLVGRKRPVVIQSLFARVDSAEPPPEEIEAYIGRLSDLQKQGAQISLVQIYSATRPTAHSEFKHLPLKTLSKIAQEVRSRTALRVEVF